MRLAQIVFRADSLTYLIGRALAMGGHHVDVWVTDPEFGQFDPYRFTKRLGDVPRVTLYGAAHGAKDADRYERLIVQMFPRPQHMWTSRAVHDLAAQSQAITLISAGDRSRRLRDAFRLQWQELRLLARWLGRVDRVAYKDGPHRLDLFATFRPRSVVGFGVHSSFMADAEAFAAIEAQDWAVDSDRSVCINFMGSQDPQARKACLDAVRALLNGDGSLAGKSNKRVIWHEYSDAQPGELGWRDYLGVLNESDFTLCPPGYSLLTHRVVEALLRGSIPVLHTRELDLYDVGLRDGVNCIAVEDEGWPKAVERCLTARREDVRAMRSSIRELVKSRLLYPSSSSRMRAQLGLEG